MEEARKLFQKTATAPAGEHKGEPSSFGAVGAPTLLSRRVGSVGGGRGERVRKRRRAGWAPAAAACRHRKACTQHPSPPPPPPADKLAAKKQHEKEVHEALKAVQVLRQG